MNSNQFNNQGRPVYVSSNNVNAFLSATRLENTFMIVASYTTGITPINNDIAVRLLNPLESGKNIFINSIYIFNAGTGLINRIRLLQGTILAGTPQTGTKYNYSIGSTNTGIASVQLQTGNPVITTPGTELESISDVVSLYTARYISSMMVPPGASLTIESKKAAGVAMSVQMQISYWEEFL